METRDGFIIGIHTYCDRWCERCPLSRRCHLFVEEQLARESAAREPPSTGPRARSRGALPADPAADDCAKHEDEAGSASRRVRAPSALRGEAAALDRRARALGRSLLDRRIPPDAGTEPKVADALRMVGHFGAFLGPKIHRALVGRAQVDEHEAQSDANGCAKAALLALDELEAAWLSLATAGLNGVAEPESIFGEVRRVRGELERLFPRARAFVRPGLDEPVAVAMLEWSERG
ncbi:MAG: hypothetical protein OEW19_14310 [Acidobacteriota bacterium]|nr:hypothetical protein [Acidobacteriota bacterium]